MPILGEIRRGREIGKDVNTSEKSKVFLRSRPFIWCACECGKEHWSAYVNGNPFGILCTSCRSKINAQRKDKHWNWKGGRNTHVRGYLEVYIDANDFFASMCGKGRYILEHRLVMARYLGRCLLPFEVVHHKNGIKTDNRIENLELSTNNSHSLGHSLGYKDGYRKGYIDGKNKRITELEIELAEIKRKLYIKSA